MELCGTEVKSIRQGKCSIKESYIQIINGEVFAINMNITPYEKGNIFNKDPLRPKKLLLHRSEINKLAGQLSTKGYTLVPLQVYLKYGKVKMQTVKHGVLINYRNCMVCALVFDDDHVVTAIKFMGTTVESRKKSVLCEAKDLSEYADKISEQVVFIDQWWANTSRKKVA